MNLAILRPFQSFFTSYIDIFYKTKVQTVILRCLTSLNLNWIKSYYMNHKNCVFQFWKKKTENLSFKNSPFWTICGHFFGNYIDIFHKTEIPTVILRCIVCRNLNWIKSYNKILVKICIFSCLKIHHFRGILPK